MRGQVVGLLLLASAVCPSSGFHAPHPGALPMRHLARASPVDFLRRRAARGGLGCARMIIELSNSVAERPDALVVGGGPGGLAAAIMLARNGWKDVTVLERRDTAGAFERQLAYVYNVDARGQNFTDAVGITPELFANGVSAENFTFTRILPDKRGATPPATPMMATLRTVVPVWIARSELLAVLSDAATAAGVKIQYSTHVEELKQLDGGVVVTCRVPESEDRLTYAPKLLVGCDGIASGVRENLRLWTGDEGFAPKTLLSPAGGLRYKMLVIPADMEIKNLSNPESEPIRLEPERSYTIVSKFTGRYTNLRLGLLPSKGGDGNPRTANIIQPAKHKIWGIQKGGELLDYLEEAFPQVDIRKYISEEQAETFIKSKGGQFPHPQYVPKLQKMVGSTAVVLMGDSIHAFPPDLGQGVNAALEDVMDFKDCLDAGGGGPDTEMGSVLEKYQEVRAPEAKAIAQLVQIGFPYQYSQSVWRVKLFMVNFILRKVLNTLAKYVALGRVFNPPAVVLMPGSRYTEAWRRAQRTTFALLAVAVLVAARVLLPFTGIMPFLGA